jgi:hypothetical protein
LWYIIQARGSKDTPVHDTPLSLLPKNLLDLTDLFLNFAGYLFLLPFAFQIGIHSDFPGRFASQSAEQPENANYNEIDGNDITQ